MTGAVLERAKQAHSGLLDIFAMEHMNDCANFVEGTKRGLKDYREGKLIPWARVKKDLGYE